MTINMHTYFVPVEMAAAFRQRSELPWIEGLDAGNGRRDHAAAILGMAGWFTREIRAGEGVYGLKRAIAVSGARSSLLSLWKVDDRATAAFMRSYYKKLKAGLGRAEALSSTQEEFRNHRIPMWRHPYVWAAFQLSGDWRPIQLLKQVESI